jgi:hypothetical protein
LATLSRLTSIGLPPEAMAEHKKFLIGAVVAAGEQL